MQCPLKAIQFKNLPDKRLFKPFVTLMSSYANQPPLAQLPQGPNWEIPVRTFILAQLEIRSRSKVWV